MKVYQFVPNPLNKGPERPGAEAGPKAAKPGSPDFAAMLKAASSPATAGPGSPDGAVSQENIRALRLPPADELGRAGSLLNRLNTDIRAANPETLKNVHNLEGLVYVYSKAGV